MGVGPKRLADARENQHERVGGAASEPPRAVARP
jgi:hypothetical protein